MEQPKEFEITTNHLKLLQNLYFNQVKNEFCYVDTVIQSDVKRPLGNTDWEDDVLTIIGEKKNIEYDEYSKSQLELAKKIFNELGVALSICLFFLEFKTGKFKRKELWNNWEKIN